MSAGPEWFLRICLHLVAASLCVGVFYLSWIYVGADLSFGFPPNSMGGAMELPLRLASTAIVALLVGVVFKLVTLDLPRFIRRRIFWHRKRTQ